MMTLSYAVDVVRFGFVILVIGLAILTNSVILIRYSAWYYRTPKHIHTTKGVLNLHSRICILIIRIHCVEIMKHCSYYE